MVETIIHHNYVKKIYEYILQMLDENEKCFVKADLFGCDKPHMTYDNYIPDVMFCYSKKLIIGEAKTLEDFKTEHSYQQYRSYVKECSEFPGTSTIIICVPWQLVATAMNHFKLLIKEVKTKINVIVLSDNDIEVRV